MPDWVDSSGVNTAGRIVEFTRFLDLESDASSAQLHFSADTRYKCYVNGQRVAVGPSRSSSYIWYYDSLDIAPYLAKGRNEIKFLVIRYFAANRAAMPFERTAFPGLTVTGNVQCTKDNLVLDSDDVNWAASINESVDFPTGLIDDGFLHVSLFRSMLRHCNLILTRCCR